MPFAERDGPGPGRAERQVDRCPLRAEAEKPLSVDPARREPLARSQDHPLALDDPHDRVRRGVRDGDLVVEEEIGDPAEHPPGLLEVGGRRAAVRSAVPRDHRGLDAGQQEPLERARGEHAPEVGRVGRDLGGDPAAQLPAGRTYEDDGSRGRAHLVELASAHHRGAEAAPEGELIAEEHRERPVAARRSASELRDRGRVVGADHEVEAADALDRRDVPGLEGQLHGP